MKFNKKTFTEDDFIRVRDFLKESFKEQASQNNWLIDRWNFCRYMGQIMHDTFDTWINTVGIWEDEKGEIVAVVNSEGEIINRRAGMVFFQLAPVDFSDDFVNELINHGEAELALCTQEGTFVQMVVNEDAYQMKDVLNERGYVLKDKKDVMSVMDVRGELEYDLSQGFRIVDATRFGNAQKGFAHGRAFGYYKNDTPDDDDGERSFESLRRAPDYRPELDLAVLNPNGQIAAFAGFWFDDLNKIGIIEPVGTVPEHRKQGLGKAVIYEGINRLVKLGANKVFVGSNQQFYMSIGFELAYSKEVWEKKLS